MDSFNDHSNHLTSLFLTTTTKNNQKIDHMMPPFTTVTIYNHNS